MLLSRFLRIKRSGWSVHLKRSKCPAVVVLHVSFSYPVVFVRCSVRFKLDQMSRVVVLVHVARLSQRKVVLLLRFGVVAICSWSAFGELSVSQLLSVGRSEGLSFFSAPHFLQ